MRVSSLYVFVDESGEPNTDRCYAVAGCWVVSDRSNPNDVLMPTKDRLIATIEGSEHGTDSISELKGAATPPPVLDTLLSYLRSGIYDDSTIRQSKFPWQVNSPIRYTLHDVNSSAGADAVADIVGPQQTGETLQTLALASILSPLHHGRRIHTGEFDQVEVYLDAQVWQNPARRLTEVSNLTANDVQPVSFETRDSKGTPGIQLADLGAYSWRRNLLYADCETAASTLNDLRFFR